MGAAVTKRASITVDAPSDVVWAVFADVERWPAWTASVTSIHLLDGALRVGARARIRQPNLPKVTWTVTELQPGRSWTWVAASPGARTVATHVLTPSGNATLVEQSIVQDGVLGRRVGRLYAKLTDRYLTLEAEGLKRRSEQVAAADVGSMPE